MQWIRRQWREWFYAYSFWYLVGREKRPGAKVIFERELGSIKDSVTGYMDWQISEQEIISDRLSRRFDLSQALNESAKRAIEEKKALVEHELTANQLAALEFQQEYLQSIMRKS